MQNSTSLERQKTIPYHRNKSKHNTVQYCINKMVEKLG